MPAIISRKHRRGDVSAADRSLEAQLSGYIEELGFPDRSYHDQAKISELAVAAVKALGHTIKVLDTKINEQRSCEKRWREIQPTRYDYYIRHELEKLSLGTDTDMHE